MMPVVEEVRRSAVGPARLDGMTADRAKAETYRYDTYLREGLRSFAAVDGFTHVDELTFVVLKPDAVAGRRCRLILDVLREEGWIPVAATTVRFDPLLTRELWRYQFNAASEQRIAVVDHLLGSGPALLVLLHDVRRPAWLPASVRLTSAKGSADPEAARGSDLRTRIGRVNGLFNFVHTADDPADVVRELQLFSYQTGWEWCRKAFADPAARSRAAMQDSDPARALLSLVEEAIPAHDLNVAASLERLAAGTGVWADLARGCPVPEHVESWLACLRTVPLPDGVARWDVLTVCTSWIECNEASVTPILATLPASAWRSGAHDTLASEREQ